MNAKIIELVELLITLTIAGWWSLFYSGNPQIGNTFPIHGDLYLIVSINTTNGTMKCIKLCRKSREQFPYAKKGDIIICPNGDIFTVMIKNLENHNSIYCLPYEMSFELNDIKSGNFWRSS